MEETDENEGKGEMRKGLNSSIGQILHRVRCCGVHPALQWARPLGEKDLVGSLVVSSAQISALGSGHGRF